MSLHEEETMMLIRKGLALRIHAVVALCIIAGISLALVTGAWGGGSNRTGESEDSQGYSVALVKAKKYSFAIVQVLDDPFFNSVFLGAKQEARKLGGSISVRLAGPSQVDPQQQVAAFKALVNARISGIAVAPTDAKAIVPAVKEAVKAGIPVVDYNLTIADPSLVVSQVLTKTLPGAKAAGRRMCAALGGKGSVFIAGAHAGNPTLQLRWNGFRAGLASCPNVKTVFHVIGCEPSQATGIVKSAIVRDSKLIGFYADSQCTATSVVQAVRSSGLGKTAHVYAYDATPDEVNALKAGKIQLLIAQKGLLQGQLSLRYLWKAVHHAKVPKLTYTGTVLMTKANLAQTQKWAYPAGGGQK
jgi:ribose transport system substrate-binding protein